MSNSHETQIPALEDKDGNIDPKKVKEVYHPGTYFIHGGGEDLIKQLLLTHPRTASIAQKIKQEDEEKKQGNELERAARFNEIAIVRTLLAAKVSPNQKGNAGCNALVSAASAGHVNVAKLLLDHKADVNIKGRIDYDNYGPPLVFAAKYGHPEMTQLLIEAKADLELKEPHKQVTALDATILAHFYGSDHGWLPWQIELDARALDVILLLLKHNAQIHYSQELLRFLKKCDTQNPNNPKVIDGLKFLCKQLEDRGIQVPQSTKWRNVTLFARSPSNDSEVLESARRFLKEKERELTKHSSVFPSCAKDDSNKYHLLTKV